MSEAELKSTIVVLRSLANSQKNASINDLARDFGQTEGGVIPYKKFGYPSLEAFLVGSGEFFVTPWKTVQAKCNAESAHINKLVAEQNNKTKKRSKKFIPPRHLYQTTFQKQSSYQATYNRPTPNYQQSSGSYKAANYQAPYVPKPTKPAYLATPLLGFGNSATNGYDSYNAKYHTNSARDYSKPQNGSKPVAVKPRSDQPSFVFTFDKPVQDLNEVKTEKVAGANSTITTKTLESTSKTTKVPELPKPEPPRIKSEVYKVPNSVTLRSTVVKVPNKTSEPRIVTVIDSGTRNVPPGIAQPKVASQTVPKRETIIPDGSMQKKPVDLRELINQKLASVKENNQSVAQVQPICHPPSPVLVSVPRAEKTPSPPPVSSPKRVVAIKSEPSPKSPKQSLVSHRLNVRTELASTHNTSNQSLASSVTDPPDVSVNPFSDPIADLAQYAKRLGWTEPEYCFHKLPSDRIQCRVLINNLSISSHPTDFSNKLNAQIFTAQEALRQFARLPEHPKPKLDIVDCLHEWLRHSPNGVFVQYIPDRFKKATNITLPDNWIALVAKQANRFSVETAVGSDNKILYAEDGFANVANELIPALGALSLNPAQSAAAIEKQVEETVPEEVVAVADVIAVPPESGNGEPLDRLVLPWTDRCWNMNITNAVTTNEVWGRLIGPDYSDKLDDLMVDIEMDILQTKYRPTSTVVGQIYLAVSEFTFRVRIERNDFTQATCLCFCIDNGVTEWYPMDQIFVCRPEFLKFPAQAFCLSLFGLEDCAEHPRASTCLESMLNDQSLIAAVITKKMEYEMHQLTNPDEVSRLTAILYDTSSDEDVQLNDVLLDEICSETEWPSFDQLGLTPVIISHVSSTGEIFCQPQNNADDLKYVQSLIEKTVKQRPLENHRFSKDDGPNRLFLVKDPAGHQWYRATLGERTGSRQDTFYVDVGCSQVVDVNNIYRLCSLSQVLQKYPHQAIGCQLFEVDSITPAIVDRLKGYLQPGTAAMVKYMTMTPDEKRSVKIFMRYQNGPLLNVNYSIQLEDEIQRYTSPEPVDDKSILKKSFPKSVSAPIPSPALLQPLEKSTSPAVGQLFKVHITLACNPHDFRVRAHRHVRPLEELMIKLQDYVKVTPDFVPNADIRVGQAYVCQQNDEVWYRVVVQKLFSGSVFLISYCDYGDINVITGQRLKVLPAQFRTLPELSIRARLAGVAPRHKEWETDDCLQFQQLTVDKKFVSRVEKMRSIGINGDETQIELKLVDVSSDQDVDIAAVLLQRKIAIPAN